MNYYKKNMRLLKKNHRSLYNRMQEYSDSNKFTLIKNQDDSEQKAVIKDVENDIKILVKKTRSKYPTIKVNYNDKEIYFHSKYAPLREARKKIKNFKPKNNKQVFALGFGLGFHLNELANRKKYDKLIIVEPYISILYTAINFIDLTNILSNNNIRFVIDNQPNLFDVIRSDFVISLKKELSFLEHTPSLKLFENDYKDIYQKIREGINYKMAELNTNIKRSREWRNNIIANLPHIFKNPKADDFFGELKDIPAICVSAGPSLDKNIEQIKKAEDKALIMCVGTSLKPLLKNGIKPDIVVTMDGNKANYNHFKDIEDISDSFLFAELGNYYKIQNKWNDKQVFFSMKRNFSGWVEKLKGKYSPIQTGGTVAHSMVDLAYKMGADPIILVGQDLAYQKEKAYASNTTYDGKNKIKQNLVEIEDIYGNMVKTSKSFLSMLIFFNNYFSKRPNRTYIDASEGGAKIENTIIMKLKDAINNYCNKDIKLKVKKLLKNKFYRFKDNIENNELESYINKTLEELDEAISLSEKLIKQVENIENKIKEFKDIKKINLKKYKKKIKEYEKKIQKIDSARYCTERILIIELMKHEKVKSKYYIDKTKGLKEKMKYYRIYRKKYLKELKECKNLLMDLYNKNEINQVRG